MQPPGTKKKSCNLSAQKKNQANSQHQEKHATSQPKKKSYNLLADKKNHAKSRHKKNVQPLFKKNHARVDDALDDQDDQIVQIYQIYQQQKIIYQIHLIYKIY